MVQCSIFTYRLSDRFASRFEPAAAGVLGQRRWCPGSVPYQLHQADDGTYDDGRLRKEEPEELRFHLGNVGLG
jgi:hypothetical protein